MIVAFCACAFQKPLVSFINLKTLMFPAPMQLPALTMLQLKETADIPSAIKITRKIKNREIIIDSKTTGKPS